MQHIHSDILKLLPCNIEEKSTIDSFLTQISTLVKSVSYRRFGLFKAKMTYYLRDMQKQAKL